VSLNDSAGKEEMAGRDTQALLDNTLATEPEK